MNIVITGHVDHGKSTIIGKLLADTGSLTLGKLEKVKRQCELNSRPFEYAFLLDALKDEQSQGITIDSARVFFKTEKREYIIIDAPGHVEFLKNMISGASRAEAALMVIDALEGIKENSRRHSYMLSMLGIKQLVVLVNKMDLVEYSEKVFNKIETEYRDFLGSIGIQPSCFIPICGRSGENIAFPSISMDWFRGKTVLNILDSFVKEKSDLEKPFRMPVQAIYKFTANEDSRRIIAGTVESGKAKCGDEIIFYPSGKKSKIKTIECFNSNKLEIIEHGMAVGFTLEEQIYIKRGEIASIIDDLPPSTGKNISVNLFWLGRLPFVKEKEYFLKVGTAKIGIQLTEIKKIIDISDLSFTENKNQIERHEIAECILQLEKPIAFDIFSNITKTSRFVIVDEYEIAGGGIITSVLPDKMTEIREKVFFRNFKWEKSQISHQTRAEKYNQKAILIIITGEPGSGKKTVAKKLESILFNSGKIVYYLGIGNVKHGIDADIDKNDENRDEHLRRTAEVAHLLLDAGIILILTARNLTSENLEIFKSVINPESIEIFWTGINVMTDLRGILKIPGLLDVNLSTKVILNRLQNIEVY